MSEVGILFIVTMPSHREHFCNSAASSLRWMLYIYIYIYIYISIAVCPVKSF